MIKQIRKKTEEEGSDMKEALAVFRNTSNESPNQLFFLRNWRDHNLPDLTAEPVMEEMMKAREMVNGGCYKVREDEFKAAWPALHAGDMVRGNTHRPRSGASRRRCWRWSIGTGHSMWTWTTARPACWRGTA